MIKEQADMLAGGVEQADEQGASDRYKGKGKGSARADVLAVDTDQAE